MDEPVIYLDILREELDNRQLQEVLNDFFQNIQICIEEIIEGILNEDFAKITDNLITVQVLSSTMYAPYLAEFSLLCESYSEKGKESCLKEAFVLLFKQLSLLKKECHEYL